LEKWKDWSYHVFFFFFYPLQIRPFQTGTLTFETQSDRNFRVKYKSFQCIWRWSRDLEAVRREIVGGTYSYCKRIFFRVRILICILSGFLKISPGDSGWDVFTLDYHIDGPIATVLTPQVMHEYMKLFTFLWRLKRVEFALGSCWRDQVTQVGGFRGVGGESVRKDDAIIS
jgi:hypothetical protein